MKLDRRRCGWKHLERVGMFAGDEARDGEGRTALRVTAAAIRFWDSRRCRNAG